MSEKMVEGLTSPKKKVCRHIQKSMAVNDDKLYVVQGSWVYMVVEYWLKHCPLCGRRLK